MRQNELSTRLARRTARHWRTTLNRRLESTRLPVRLSRFAPRRLTLLRHAILLDTTSDCLGTRPLSSARGAPDAPVYRLQKRLVWRHTNSGHDHSHLADANHRSRSIGPDHHVAQIDHRHSFPITTPEYFLGCSNHTTRDLPLSTADSTTFG